MNLLHQSTVEAAIYCYEQYVRSGKTIMADWEIEWLAKHGIAVTIDGDDLRWTGAVLT